MSTVRNEKPMFDLSALDDLKFDPPCEYPKGCNETATWILRSEKSCGCNGPILMCEWHKKQQLELFQSYLEGKTYLDCLICGAKNVTKTFLHAEPL